MSGQVASVIDEQQIGGLAEAAGIDGVKDHDMGEYLKAIEAWDIRD